MPCFLAYDLTNEIHSPIVTHCVGIITQYFLFSAEMRGGLGVLGAAVIRDTALLLFRAGVTQKGGDSCVYSRKLSGAPSYVGRQYVFIQREEP